MENHKTPTRVYRRMRGMEVNERRGEYLALLGKLLQVHVKQGDGQN